MYLIIEFDYEIAVCRQLSPTESLDCAHHAEQFGIQLGYSVDISESTSTGLGADVDVTIQPTKAPGSVRVWDSRGFYFD